MKLTTLFLLSLLTVNSFAGVRHSIYTSEDGSYKVCEGPRIFTQGIVKSKAPDREFTNYTLSEVSYYELYENHEASLVYQYNTKILVDHINGVEVHLELESQGNGGCSFLY